MQHGILLKKHSIIISLLFLASTLFSREYKVIEQENSRVRLQVVADIPAPADDSVHAPFHVDEWPVYKDVHGYAMPYRPILVQLNSRSARLHIITVSEQRTPSPPPAVFEERAVGADSLTPLAPLAPTRAEPVDVAELTYLGLFKQNHLWRVDVYPYRYDEQSGELIIRGTIVFDVIGDDVADGTQPVPEYDMAFMKKLGIVAVSATQTATSGQSLQKRRANDDVQRWKLIVGEDGIYRITGQDLLEAGVRLLDIDFRNIRLTSNGRDVSLYPHGWRDGQFDPEDYIEFWGEQRRQTFQDKAPDMYQDPVTKNSVYWLSWEKRGLWMAEESGQITDSQPGQFIRPYSFLETVHHEEDNYYDHLSSIPIDSLRDHWFFDDGISAGKKVDYKIYLRHPDDQSPLRVTARVMMSGRTTIINLSHNISAFLNGSFLFSHKWKGQAIADLQSVDDSFITGADLHDGENILSIVNNVTPQNFDFVMLNWFEVTYPRLYRAYEDFLKFKIPPNYDNGKFLFRIDGFVDPQIDVYKLHQSKIVGGLGEEVTDFNDFTSLQISFQNDVLSP